MLLNLTDLVAGRGPSGLDVARDACDACGCDDGAPSMVTWLAAGGRDALSTDEGLALVDGIAASGAALLRLAGAPLTRPDAFEFVAQARLHGLPLVIVAGTEQVDAASAVRLRAYAADDVHVTLPLRRGLAYPPRAAELRAATAAYHRCERAGQRVALALPLTRAVVGALDTLLDYAELHGIRRLVFTRRHPRGAGGAGGAPAGVTPGLLGARVAVGTLINRAALAAARGDGLEISLAGDFAAGPFAVLVLAGNDSAAALGALREVERRARYAASEVTVDAVGGVALDAGDAAAPLGSVRERRFDAIWRVHAGASAALHRVGGALPGGSARWPTPRCPGCQWVDVCGVQERVAASAAGLPTPPAAAVSAACYLSDEEIGLSGPRVREPADVATPWVVTPREVAD